uniref:Uncharacterized protein LOC104212948 n=1 Tax=Nicotiana sylvestris TaxID=4096 RepID=A0A1U7VE78_NICSY|nr:PREDICTED: uncharacterized protein LOC104212948 [Nicotiana sylvestris]
MPEVPKYDRTSDPHEHIATYTTVVKGNDLAPHEIESVLLKKFGETLTRGALTWYSLLPEYSIDSFEMLADSFIKAYAGNKKVQKERMLLPAVPDKWTDEAFTKGLNLRSSNTHQKLKESLLEFKATIWTDVHNQYELKIRIKDDQVGFPSSVKEREKDREKLRDDYDRKTSRGQFLLYEWTEGRRRNHQTIDKFTVDKRTDRGRNNRSLQEKEIHEKYQRTTIPETNEIRSQTKGSQLMNGQLREFLSDRAKNNYGRNRDNVEPSKAGEEPPRQTISMIFEGNAINGVTFSAAKKTKVSITHSKRLREDDINFTEEDADGFLLPHNNTLVISLNALDFKIKRVLVDPRS